MMKCHQCGYERKDTISHCPSCGSSNQPPSFILLSLCILVVFGFVFFAIQRGCSSTTSTNSAVGSHAETVCDPAAKYGANAYESAKLRMEVLRRNNHIFEEGGHLVVEMKQYQDNRNDLLRFATLVADADAVLNCAARNIYIDDPSGKRVTQADPINGIRVLE